MVLTRRFFIELITPHAPGGRNRKAYRHSHPSRPWKIRYAAPERPERRLPEVLAHPNQLDVRGCGEGPELQGEVFRSPRHAVGFREAQLLGSQEVDPRLTPSRDLNGAKVPSASHDCGHKRRNYGKGISSDQLRPAITRSESTQRAMRQARHCARINPTFIFAMNRQV